MEFIGITNCQLKIKERKLLILFFCSRYNTVNLNLYQIFKIDALDQHTATLWPCWKSQKNNGWMLNKTLVDKFSHLVRVYTYGFFHTNAELCFNMLFCSLCNVGKSR